MSIDTFEFLILIFDANLLIALFIHEFTYQFTSYP